MPAHHPEHASDTPYQAALHRLLSLVDLERMRGAVTPVYKYDLERMRELAARLHLLDGGPPLIHVAGTKGKGSVAAMTASVLREHGLRTGLYTSPHLHSFRERIRLNGEPLSESTFAAAVSRIWPVVENMADEPIGAPSTFEAITAMALDTFREKGTDAVVLEVGLGGRLDATNVVTSDVAVITSVSLDHTAILGSTVEEIAGEKAGIVKGAQPVVSAPQHPDAMAVIRERAHVMGAPLTEVGHDVTYAQEEHDLSGQTVSITTARDRYRIRVPLLGAHQAENAAVAVAALEQAPLPLTRDAIEAGLAAVRWDGRFQLLASAPYLIVDGAHNPYSMARLHETVREYLPGVRVHLVFGASGDKQIDLLVQEAAAFADEVWTVASRHPRAAHQDMLASAFEQLDTNARSASSVAEGIERAMSAAGAGDLVLVTGSLFAVAEALQHSLGIDGEHYPEFDPQASALGRV